MALRQSELTRENQFDDVNANQLQYRLPRNVIPYHYRLYLDPDVNEKRFGGNVTIKVKVSKSTETIALHSNKLNIRKVAVKSNTNLIPVQSAISTSDKREFLIINLDQRISSGNYTIEIQFDGRMDKGIVGLYASTLRNSR
ncbi:Glutamyl aminopeptidase [Eumeta japonica]|uniref:Glutamyl aminopeptidase n=1 Tax=Eumeta variegata TaxID=151549 RepID=A0A4C2A2Z3_EUMVA|nr:Glutamyl aminopeptidase [Eumeta japonica]